MASTNKTTNYELSQYIGTDKPTYLTDYNQDMTKIDAGIHAAKSEADNNTNAIGDLTSLTTTAKTSLVAAVNEIDADVATNTNNIATNTSNIATNTTHIGTVANLTTATKTDLVVAANEINAKVGNTANLETNDKSSTVAAINEVNYNIDLLNLTTHNTISNSDITTTLGNINSSQTTVNCSTNASKTLAKIYGRITVSISPNTADSAYTVSFPTSLAPSSNITINTLGILYTYNSNGTMVTALEPIDLAIATDGTASISCYHYNQYLNGYIILNPCLLYISDFGDSPIPPAPPV